MEVNRVEFIDAALTALDDTTNEQIGHVRSSNPCQLKSATPAPRQLMRGKTTTGSISTTLQWRLVYPVSNGLAREQIRMA
jgi:hypothetical protein